MSKTTNVFPTITLFQVTSLNFCPNHKPKTVKFFKRRETEVIIIWLVLADVIHRVIENLKTYNYTILVFAENAVFFLTPSSTSMIV